MNTHQGSRIGLTLGKFLPLHNGHLALIEFAAAQCSELIVLLCVADSEPISGELRLKWLQETTKRLPNVTPILFRYDESILPNSSVSDDRISEKWAHALKSQFPHVETFFSSEPYGEFVAQHWGISHISFNESRNVVPISATQIREQPIRYWSFLPDAVKPYFVQNIGILGTESVGKSTLAQQLAAHFQTNFVREIARDIISHTETCSMQDIQHVAKLHAEEIERQRQSANRILFLDTTLHLSKSYAQFLFDTEFKVEQWIEDANECALFLYLLPDVPFVQDGTRLDESQRNALDLAHRRFLASQDVPIHFIGGTWETRFKKAVSFVKQYHITHS